MGTLTYKGAVAKESTPSESLAMVDSWAASGGFTDNAAAVAGAEIFAQVGCQNCHTYQGSGGSIGPDLTAIGKTSNRGVEGFATYVANPADFGNTKMPSFSDLGQDNLAKLGAFLQASQGSK
jgi:mono/diheme cytochrome c family protein